MKGSKRTGMWDLGTLETRATTRGIKRMLSRRIRWRRRHVRIPVFWMCINFNYWPAHREGKGEEGSRVVNKVDELSRNKDCDAILIQRWCLLQDFRQAWHRAMKPISTSSKKRTWASNQACQEGSDSLAGMTGISWVKTHVCLESERATPRVSKSHKTTCPSWVPTAKDNIVAYRAVWELFTLSHTHTHINVHTHTYPHTTHNTHTKYAQTHTLTG